VVGETLNHVKSCYTKKPRSQYRISAVPT